jgi:DNA (cytosine-5)-methyltransferase 1
LTVREYARIQSFPDTWKFAGSTASQYKQIGNAVPVNLGFHLGKCLIAMLDGSFDKKNMEYVLAEQNLFAISTYTQPDLFEMEEALI